MAAFGDALAPKVPTASDLVVLALVHRESQTIREICRGSGRTRQAVASVLRSLVERGLLTVEHGRPKRYRLAEPSPRWIVTLPCAHGHMRVTLRVGIEARDAQ